MTHPTLTWLAYVTFVVYGSLVPLDFQPVPLEQAWAAFKHLPMLQVGVQGRADWVSNGVLYVPVGFLTVALFAGRRTLLTRLPLLIGAALFSFALALAVEFAQLFFPPRTVSLNDVVAECIGSVLGIVLAVHGSGWFREVLATLTGRFGQVTDRALQAYAVAYLAFSLFPFDFLLSLAELANKADSDAWAWFLSVQSTDRGPVILLAKLCSEILAVLPLGLMLGRRNMARQRPATQRAVLCGIILGLTIEVLQLFMYSGVSQGVSVVTRVIGMYCGALLGSDPRLLLKLRAHAANKPLTGPLMALYLPALVAVNGWFDHRWHGLELARTTLTETRYLPFYYHYYTTEQAALLSLVSVALMYAPLGLLAWLARWSPANAFWAAAFAALAIESSKPFLAGLHPDPTNVLIGAIAAWSVCKLLQRLLKASEQPVATTAPGSPQPAGRTGVPAAFAATASLPPVAALAAALILTSWMLFDFPFAAGLLGPLLLCYAALLWFDPRWLWAAIPAALPLLDLAPWSGRYYFDEFDCLIMVSLAVGYARTRPAPRGSRGDVVAWAVAGLLALTIAIATLRGMSPLSLPDGNSFNTYYSAYNALRVAKGALWALLLFALLQRFSANEQGIGEWFAKGMVAGLAGTVAVILWERAVFPGLFNFTDVYRVTGPFSQMHIGGSYIETFLTAALPFAVFLTVQARSIAGRLGGGMLVLGASYAVGVTFSRAGNAGFALSLIVACLAAWRSRRLAGSSRTSAARAGVDSGRDEGSRSQEIYRRAAPWVLVGLAAAAAFPIYSGSFAQERIAALSQDLAARRAHWEDALAIRDAGITTALFGMGLGRFPETHYWRSSEPKATGYRIETEAGKTFLRLGTGTPLYIEQFVSIEPDHVYVLYLDIRSPAAGAALSASLCEKLLLTSGRCVTHTAAVGEGVQEWQQHEFRLASGDIGRGSWLTRPPVKLSLFNDSRARVDIRSVRLQTEDGEQLTRNGDFERGLDRWFFSVDEHLAWHIKSMPLAILFDQGWFGLLSFAALLALGITRTTRQAWQGDLLAGAALASLAGVLVITTVDTVIDSPRFLLLFLLLVWVGWNDANRQRR